MYVFLRTFSIFPFKRYTHQLLRGKRNNQSKRQIVGCNAKFYLRYINVMSIVGFIGAILGMHHTWVFIPGRHWYWVLSKKKKLLLLPSLVLVLFTFHVNQMRCLPSSIPMFFFAKSQFDWPITRQIETMDAPQNSGFYFEVQNASPLARLYI